MKKIILAFFLLFPLLALADATDMRLKQRNITDTGDVDRFLTTPAANASAIWYFDGPTVLPGYLAVGTGLAISGGALISTASTFDGAYSSLTGIPSTFAPAPHNQAWSTITSTPTTVSGYAITDAATTTQLSTGLAAKFNIPTGTAVQYVRGDGALATLPVASVPSQSASTRTLNTIFQVSSTRAALVFYSVQVTVTASISGGQDGDVFLEIASDSGFTTNVQTIMVAPSSQVYTLAIALQGVQKASLNVSGFVPPGYYARLRTVNNTGTPTFLYRAGQEVLL